MRAEHGKATRGRRDAAKARDRQSREDTKGGTREAIAIADTPTGRREGASLPSPFRGGDIPTGRREANRFGGRWVVFAGAVGYHRADQTF